MEEELPVHNSQTDNKESLESIVKVTGMYKDWFLDYASSVSYTHLTLPTNREV